MEVTIPLETHHAVSDDAEGSLYLLITTHQMFPFRMDVGRPGSTAEWHNAKVHAEQVCDKDKGEKVVHLSRISLYKSERAHLVNRLPIITFEEGS
jgi:hypothetical protein